MKLWPVLVADPQVELGRLKMNPSFQKYVEDLPKQLKRILPLPLTIGTLMEAQYLAVEGFNSTDDSLQLILRGLSRYNDPELFLQTLGITIPEYCHIIPGMSKDEVAKMLAGSITVEEILQRRPAVILSPLLRRLIVRN